MALLAAPHETAPPPAHCVPDPKAYIMPSAQQQRRMRAAEQQYMKSALAGKRADTFPSSVTTARKDRPMWQTI